MLLLFVPDLIILNQSLVSFLWQFSSRPMYGYLCICKMCCKSYSYVFCIFQSLSPLLLQTFGDRFPQQAVWRMKLLFPSSHNFRLLEHFLLFQFWNLYLLWPHGIYFLHYVVSFVRICFFFSAIAASLWTPIIVIVYPCISKVNLYEYFIYLLVFYFPIYLLWPQALQISLFSLCWYHSKYVSIFIF